MNADSLLKTAASYFDQLCCPDGNHTHLADTIRRIRPDCTDYAEAYVVNAIQGGRLGRKMMKPFKDMTFNPNKFFCYADSQYDRYGLHSRYEFWRLTQQYKERFNSFYKDTNDRKLIALMTTGNENTLDFDDFLVVMDESLNAMRDLTAETIRDKYADMLERFWNFDSLSPADLEYLDAMFTISMLLAGLDEGLYTAQEAEDAASQLGLVVGSVHEGVRQAADSYDHLDRKSREYNIDLLVVGIWGEIAIIIGMIFGKWLWPIAKEAAIPILCSDLFLILTCVFVAIVVFLMTYLPTWGIMEQHSNRKIASRIAHEGHSRVYAVQDYIGEHSRKPTKEEKKLLSGQSIAGKPIVFA